MRRAIDIKKEVMPNGNSVKRRGRLRKFILRPVVCSVCASLGIFGGLSALVTGLLCVVIHAIVPGDQMFNRVGTIILIIAIPMILIGSVFLDEIQPLK